MKRISRLTQTLLLCFAWPTRRPCFAVVVALLGCLTVSLLSFILPPLFYQILLRKRDAHRAAVAVNAPSPRRADGGGSILSGGDDGGSTSKRGDEASAWCRERWCRRRCLCDEGDFLVDLASVVFGAGTMVLTTVITITHASCDEPALCPAM